MQLPINEILPVQLQWYVSAKSPGLNVVLAERQHASPSCGSVLSLLQSCCCGPMLQQLLLLAGPTYPLLHTAVQTVPEAAPWHVFGKLPL